jgi:hypothetical protein
MADHHDMATPDDLERRRTAIRGALDALRDTVLEIGCTVEEKKGERCPYRTAGDDCTFRGGCINRVRSQDGRKTCGGDHLLKWERDQ